MKDLLVKIIPILLIFFLGMLLKQVRLFNKEDGDRFLSLVFHVSLPALILPSVMNIALSLEFIFLPICAIAIIFGTYAVALLVSRHFQLERKSLAVFLVGSTIVNTGFTLPFFIAVYGKEGLARASMFDLGNGFLVFTFIYYLALKYSSRSSGRRIPVHKFFLLPPLWALAIAILLNVLHVQLPAIASNLLGTLGNLTTPLIMLSLGIYFKWNVVNFKAMTSVIFIRMGVGLLLGFILVSIFHLEQVSRMVVLINAASPVGYNTLIYASMEDLDTEFAASLVSISILLGLLYTPLLLALLS
ncbi:MAG: AEC family transporter [Candidatus Zhuqueibacterota bacterium]